MAQETPDYLVRQRAKVKPLISPIGGVHVHTRRRCVVCREARKQRKHEKKLREHETLEKVALAALEVPKELIRGAASISSSIAEAHGRAAGAWLSANPLAWAGGAAVAYAYLTWLDFLANKIVISTDKEGHVTTLSDKLGVRFLRDILPDTVLKTAADVQDAARDWAEGTLIGSPDLPDKPPTPPPGPVPVIVVRTFWDVQTGGVSRYYTNKADADHAFFLLQITIGLIKLAQGEKVVMFERRQTYTDGYLTDDRGTTVKIWP